MAGGPDTKQDAAEEAAEEQEEQILQEEVHKRRSPSGKVLYQTILQEADDELARPSSALAWSGLAAGLSMSFSFITEALLRGYLPNEPWQPLVSKFGYCVGFVVVILGRQQLFTENTLTPVLPLLLRRNLETLLNMLRLWVVVLVANLLGAWLVALVIARSEHIFRPEVEAALLTIAHEAIRFGPATILVKGIFAGWLIALVVWLLPFAEVGRFWVIILLTYVVSLGEFSHIIAGAVEVFTLGWAGEKDWLTIFAGFIAPALVGNVIGGVTLVAALNHAQVVAGGADGGEGA